MQFTVCLAAVLSANALSAPRSALRPARKHHHDVNRVRRGGVTMTVAIDVFANRVAPMVGTVIANAMFCVSLPVVLKARETKQLGDANPVPWAFILVNTMGWLHYAAIMRNPFAFWSNAPGFLLGLFFTLTACAHGSAAQRATVERITLGFSAVHLLSSCVTSLALTSARSKQLVAGLVANAILIVYYAAPLSTIADVLRSKSAASIFAPLCALSGVNGLLWTVYGLALRDPFIYVPNAIGLGLAVLQLALKLVYGDGKQQSA